MCIFIDPARICIINDLINIIPVHGGAFLSNNKGISLETDGEQHTKCRTTGGRMISTPAESRGCD